MKMGLPIFYFLENLFMQRIEERSHVLRGSFWKKFLSVGLPKKTHEAFQYLPLSRIYESFADSESSITELPSVDVSSFILEESKESCFVFLDGHFREDLSSLGGLPKQIIFFLIEEALESSYAQFLKHRMQLLLDGEEDPFALINGALFKEGLFMYIPPKIKIEAPIQFLFLSTGLSSYVGPRVHLFAGAQSEAQAVTSYHSLTSNPIFYNGLFDVFLEEKAVFTHVQHMTHDLPQIGFNFFRGTLKKEANLKSVLATFGSTSLRHDYKMALLGEAASAELSGLCAVNESNQAHVHVYMDHSAYGARSYQLFKNVLFGQSKASFTGKIHVKRPAQKTEAYQLNKNLLFSDLAMVYSKPNLEVFADDVKASHGCTISQMDKEQLHYLRTRGIPSKEAEALVTLGFCDEILEKIPMSSLRRQLLSEMQSFLLL